MSINISKKEEESNVIIGIPAVNIGSGCTGTSALPENISIDLNTISLDKAISRSHVSYATNLINGVEEVPLSSELAALKPHKGQSTIKGILPQSTMSKFFRENLDMLREEPGDINWLLPGLWFRGMTWMLCGDPDVGKTTYTLSQMKKLICGEPVFAGAYLPSKPLRVSYYVADASKQVSASVNIKKLGMSWGCQEGLQCISHHQVRDLYFKATNSTFSIGDENGRNFLREMIKNHRSDILIIDTLGGGLENIDENKPSEISPVMSAYRSLAGELNICIIIIHHFRKRGLDSKNKSSYRELEDVAGSKSIYGQCDSVLSIEKRFDEFGKQIPKSGIVRVLKTGAAGGVKKFPEIHFDIKNPDENTVVIEDHIADIEDTEENNIRTIILKHINENKNSSFKSLFLALQNKKGMNQRALEREIQSSKKDNLITTKGFSRKTTYELTELGLGYIKAFDIENQKLNEVEQQEEKDNEFDLSFDGITDEHRVKLDLLKAELDMLANWDLSKENAPDFVDLNMEREDRDFEDYKETLERIVAGKYKNSTLEEKLHSLSHYHYFERQSCNARIITLRDKALKPKETDWRKRNEFWKKDIEDWKRSTYDI